MELKLNRFKEGLHNWSLPPWNHGRKVILRSDDTVTLGSDIELMYVEPAGNNLLKNFLARNVHVPLWLKSGNHKYHENEIDNGFRMLAVEILRLAVSDITRSISEEDIEEGEVDDGWRYVKFTKKKEFEKRKNVDPAESAAKWLLGIGSSILDADTVCEYLELTREVVAERVGAKEAYLSILQDRVRVKQEKAMERRRKEHERREGESERIREIEEEAEESRGGRERCGCD